MTEEDTTVTPFVLGAMSFGTRVDEATSFAVLDRFVERGGTWIDTADCYSFWSDDEGRGGASERLIGRWLEARPGMRERVRIATKVGADPKGPGEWPANREGLSRAAVRAAAGGSMERMGIERIDLLWLHQEDRAVPIEETVEALAELTSSGAAARVGASNHPAWRVERARAHAEQIGARPIDALQLGHSALEPRPGTRPPGVVHRFGGLGDEHRDIAAEHDWEIWAYTPLLGGAYDDPAKEIPEVYRHPGTTARMAVLAEVAAAHGASPGQVVLAGMIADGIRPILGGSRVAYLDAAMDAAELVLAEEEQRRLAAAR